jgi:hypothetical protein
MNVSNNPRLNSPSAVYAAQVKLPIALENNINVMSTSNTIDTTTPIAYVLSSISFSQQAIAPNFLVPSNIALGAAVVTVTANGTVTGRGAILIDTLSAALFSANGTGTGFALGTEVLTHADGTQLYRLLNQPVDPQNVHRTLLHHLMGLELEFVDEQILKHRVLVVEVVRMGCLGLYIPARVVRPTRAA